jgi:hypothetical protein
MLLALLLGSFAAAGETRSLRLDQLTAGQQFDVHTEHRLYRSELVDQKTGECRMWASWDGQRFSEERTVYLLGATRGPQEGFTLVAMHEIKIGQKLELGIGSLKQKHRYLTGPVKSIKVYEANEQLAKIQ